MSGVTISLLFTLVALALANPAPRADPEFTIDRTADLIGKVVYFEYLHFSGNWMKPGFAVLPHYDAMVESIAEDDVFKPAENARIIVSNCGNGWACLETAAHSHYYLGLSNLDYTVNFYNENNQQPQSERFHFKILCNSADLYDFSMCNLVVNAFDDRIWQVRSDGGLTKNLHYCQNCQVDEVRWRVKVTQPFDFTETEKNSVCNTGNSDMELVLSHSLGVRNERGNWDPDTTTFEEVRHGIEFAARNGLMKENEKWLNDISDDTWKGYGDIQDFGPTTIPAGKLINFKQLRGYYGPFKVYTNIINGTLLSCA